MHHFEEAGTISVHQLTVSQDFKYDLDRMRYQFESECPDLVIMSHASNVLGLIAPVTEICSLAKKFGATTVIDMAQTAGLVDCNLGLNVFDFCGVRRSQNFVRPYRYFRIYYGTCNRFAPGSVRWYGF